MHRCLFDYTAKPIVICKDAKKSKMVAVDKTATVKSTSSTSCKVACRRKKASARLQADVCVTKCSSSSFQRKAANGVINVDGGIGDVGIEDVNRLSVAKSTRSSCSTRRCSNASSTNSKVTSPPTNGLPSGVKDKLNGFVLTLSICVNPMLCGTITTVLHLIYIQIILLT